ncbi:MAG: beta-lactamase [Mycobacterium sp.]|jgi:CubicO group peptidase (beta-lactamase class C family)|nr:beta-lactamase [Mycobacterium sp.]
MHNQIGAIVGKGELPGVVSLTYRRGEIAHVSTHGWQDVAAATPMRRDTIFQIMSMTKPVTAACALTLVDQGLIGLHQPIERFLPELRRQSVLRAPWADLDDTIGRTQSITLSDLLTFRAGIASRVSPDPWEPPTPVKVAVSAAYDEHPDNSEGWLRAIAAIPLETQPGSAWAYGTGSEVVAVLAERVSGLPYQELLTQRILHPLGMADTGYVIPADKAGRLATAYEYQPDTKSTKVLTSEFFTEHRPTTIAPAFPRGGYGLVSTVDDYLQFARMLLLGGTLDGERILSRRLASLMTTNHLSDQQRAAVPPPVRDIYRGQGWGLGLQVVIDPALQEQYVGYASRGSFGFSGALGTWWQADPVEQMIQIFMYQLLTSDAHVRRLFQNGGYDAITE